MYMYALDAKNTNLLEEKINMFFKDKFYKNNSFTTVHPFPKIPLTWHRYQQPQHSAVESY